MKPTTDARYIAGRPLVGWNERIQNVNKCVGVMRAPAVCVLCTRLFRGINALTDVTYHGNGDAAM